MGSREQRDFMRRAARGDPRAMRDFATGKVPLPKHLQPTKAPIKSPKVLEERAQHIMSKGGRPNEARTRRLNANTIEVKPLPTRLRPKYLSQNQKVEKIAEIRGTFDEPPTRSLSEQEKNKAKNNAETRKLIRRKQGKQSKSSTKPIRTLIPDKEFQKKLDKQRVGRESGAKSSAQRAKITKQQIKHDPKAPTPKNEPRAPGAGIPKKGFTKPQFNKIYKAPGGTGVTRGGGGGGPPGTLKFDQGVMNAFRRK